MNTIKILDKNFKISIKEDKIQERISLMAKCMNEDLKDENVLFVAVLNGAFMFASDLFKQINLNAAITFVKLSSYTGTVSSGKVKRLIGINEDLRGLTLVVLEDIVDTGLTMENIINQLKEYKPKDIKIATLLLKPEIFKGKCKLDYVGLEIPNEFIVGYGLDYNGYGRNLKEIYTAE